MPIAAHFTALRASCLTALQPSNHAGVTPGPARSSSTASAIASRRRTTRSRTPTCRTGTGCGRDAPHTLIDASELHVGLADGADGQLRSRTPEHRRGPRRLPGLHADRARDPERRVRRQSRRSSKRSMRRRRRRDGAHHGPAVAGRRAQPREPDPRGGRRAVAARACESVAVHAFLDGRDTPPKSAGRRSKRWKRMRGRCSKSGGALPHRLDRRALLRDGPRQALGPRPARRTTASSMASRRTAPPMPRAALDAAYARGETDEFVKPTVIGDGAPVTRRRRRRLHELPRRPRARAHAGADRPVVQRLRARARADSSRASSR